MSLKHGKPNQVAQRRETPRDFSNAPSATLGRLTLEAAPDDLIYTNHFPCSFAQDTTFYQYDATVEEYHYRQNAYFNLTNREKRRQFVTDLFLSKAIHPTAICWYDEGSCIYSTTNFSNELPIVQEKEDNGYRRRLTIRSVSATCSAQDLNQSVIRIVETLIKQVLKDQFKAIGNVFYRWDAEPKQDGPYDLVMGFRQALCLTESGPTLNVDITITRFYPHSDLLPFIWQRLLKKQPPNSHGVLTDNEYRMIGAFLKDVEVITVQSDYQDRYILTGEFSDDLPRDIIVRDNEPLTDYYRRLGFELKHPQLYCLKAYPAGKRDRLVDLPIELCGFQEWQQVTDDENIKPVPAMAVGDRYHGILSSIRNCNFRDHELCKEIQFQINCQEMLAIDYESLNTRQIRVGRQGTLINPAWLDQMGFLYLGESYRERERQVTDGFLNSFYEIANRQRMVLPDNPYEHHIVIDRQYERSLRDWFRKLKQNQCQLVICLENCRDPQVHERFKSIAYTEFGLVTQCVNFSKVQRMKNLRTYCTNLLYTINAKLSGENKQVTDLKTSVKTMYIGADVLHSKNNFLGEFPSIAAVVASMNSECTVTNQRVSRQWPSDGRQSEEAILLLQTMVEELLTAYREKNDGILPEHVIFYRDGVDDGQFDRVQTEEVAAVKRAFAGVYSTNRKHPLLTLIVVKKRHHTRLFRRYPPATIENVESGVMVETAIVNSSYPNFFLNSHEPRLGTNKIGHYVVLVDEIKFSLRELGELTYSLCHADQRISSQSSESIPSLVHLADAAASNARQLFKTMPRPANAQRADILRVHGDVQDAPSMF